ncbi:SDR family NAD(P)-dependent oxidoreductase [Streptomyces sp. NPDC059906]|uniref:SDR family NAD(P)-dependent oxidoreductase n=1 Tax=Streptomyces sp. NPDC059906 TaxID=3346997 RepID=UPI00365A3FDA
MTITLITGATRGLGRETARRLLEARHDVYLGVRDEQRRRELAARLGAHPVMIVVTDDVSVATAVDLVQRPGGDGPEGPTGGIFGNDGPMPW